MIGIYTILSNINFFDVKCGHRLRQKIHKLQLFLIKVLGRREDGHVTDNALP